MSNESISGRFDEHFRSTAIQNYAALAARVQYNEGSWAYIQHHLEQERHNQLRIKMLKTAGILASTVLVVSMIFILYDVQGVGSESHIVDIQVDSHAGMSDSESFIEGYPLIK